MNTLFAKLSTALLIIVALMGSAFFVVDRINTRAYYEELTQSLNAPIAMYVTGQRQLIESGIPDLVSLRELAAHAMIINPTAEIYLLDTAGKILGHGLPEDTVLRARADLEPIKALVDGTARMPIRGDDPRSGSSRKVFSAATVSFNGRTEGYLYVVLGGQTYEALASDIGNSYVGKVSAVVALVIVGATATIGLLVFGLLTRRLKKLSHDMRRAGDAGFELAPSVDQLTTNGDEIECVDARICGHVNADQNADRTIAGKRPLTPGAGVEYFSRFADTAVGNAGIPRDIDDQGRLAVCG